MTVTYSYDPADRLTGVTQSSSPSGNVLASYAYSYDPGNRLTQEVDSGATTTYSYDAANELTQSGALTYGYDPTGNRRPIPRKSWWVRWTKDCGDLARLIPSARSLVRGRGWGSRCRPASDQANQCPRPGGLFPLRRLNAKPLRDLYC